MAPAEFGVDFATAAGDGEWQAVAKPYSLQKRLVATWPGQNYDAMRQHCIDFYSQACWLSRKGLDKSRPGGHLLACFPCGCPAQWPQ